MQSTADNRKEQQKKHNQLNRARWEILEQLEAWLETPILILGFVWLALLILDFTHGLNPFLESVSTVIWIIFGLDFLVRFWLAPTKIRFLKSNWLTAISLLLPALRVLRLARLARLLRLSRTARGLRLVRLITSLNRGMKALGASMGRRGFGYVLALTVVVTLSGAAGMYAFENSHPGFANYGASLWWTAMLMTTLGSENWPRSGEGRLLCWALSLYAFAVFGYLTATLATFFVGREAANNQGEIAGHEALITLRDEIRALRADVQALGQEPRA